MDGLLDKPPNRQCKLLGATTFGGEYPNGSLTGALKLLKSKEGDLYLSPSTQFFVKDFLWPSQAIYSDKHVISHIIKDSKSKEIDIVSLLSYLGALRTGLIVSAIVFVWILIWLYDYITPGQSLRLKTKKIFLNFFKLKLTLKQPATKIGLMLIFYQIFWMLFKLLIASSIKTTKVVVDQSALISSVDQLLRKNIVVCWMKDDIEISLAVQSPKHSFIRRLYEEKRFKVPTRGMDGAYSRNCLLSFVNLANAFSLENKVLFMEKPSHYTFLAYFISYEPYARLWIKAFTETVNVYHYRRGLSKFQRDSIDRKLVVGLFDDFLIKLFSAEILSKSSFLPTAICSD